MKFLLMLGHARTSFVGMNSSSLPRGVVCKRIETDEMLLAGASVLILRSSSSNGSTIIAAYMQ